MTTPRQTRPCLLLALLVATLVPAWILPSHAVADGKGHTALATQSVNASLVRAGIRDAMVSSEVVELTTKTRGNRVDVSCKVRVLVASKTGIKIGPGQSATVLGSGRITSSGSSTRAQNAAKRSCVVEVAGELVRNKVAPFIGLRRVSRR